MLWQIPLQATATSATRFRKLDLNAKRRSPTQASPL